MHAPGVIVFGYGELAIAAAETLAHAGARLIALVTPSNRSGSDVDLVAAFAEAGHLPRWIQPSSRNLEPFVTQLRRAAPDVIVVWSYSMKLPQAVLDVPRLGVVNVHGGLLPEYRGGHVMQWALINGETETGVTLHYMDAGIDTGSVIAQSRFPIRADDDAVDVRNALKKTGAALLGERWPQIQGGTAPRIAQDESRARYWPMRTIEDGRIDWDATSEQICRLVRALACNQPGAFVEVDGTIVSVAEARTIPSVLSVREPGSIASADSTGVRVCAGERDVLVTKVLVGNVAVEGASVAAILKPGLSVRASQTRHAHG